MADDPDDDRRGGGPGRRALDNLRLEEAIAAVSVRVDQVDRRLDDEIRERLDDRAGVKEFVAGLPYVYVPRAEHRAGKTELWQIVVAAVAVAGLAVQIVAQIVHG